MIRWEWLEASIAEKAREWNDGSSTRFVVIDGMTEPGICAELAEFSGIAEKFAKPLLKKHKNVRGKSGTTDPARMSALQREFFAQINSDRFLRILEKITGITPIYPDPNLNGGGLHQIRHGGYLNVHTDFNFDPITQRNRRLNLLLYLNENWCDAWGGKIELWDTKLDRPFFSALPIANRVLIFETSETSYHGHPVPLTSPIDVYRKSMAVYYYSEWPQGVLPRKGTDYQLTRLQWSELIGKIGALIASREISESEIIDELQLDYMKGDIRIAYAALMGLRSPPTIAEQYWESADGSRSLLKPGEA